MRYQEKVKGLYEVIRNRFYLCRDDLFIGSDRFNSALLFGVLTELNRGKQLLFGEYGGGKTTSAEYLHSLFHNLPIEMVRRVVMRGSPQLTQEKIVGRPDYGKMHQGMEEVVWQHFILVPQKIIDEFNRIPEANQAMLLDGMDRGEWDYLNEHISTGPQPFFATCNYADRGTNTLIPPILDRFNIATECKFPGVANAVAIGYDYHHEKDRPLEDKEITDEIVRLLVSEKSYEEKKKGLKRISEKFRKRLKKEGIDTLTEEELDEIDKEIGKVTLDNDALTYLNFLIAELNQHPKYGLKRSSDPISGEEGAYLFNMIKGSGSRREDKSIIRYSQSLAWLQCLEKAGLEHVLLVAPYALWHRLRLTDVVITKLKDDDRREPLDLYIIKTVLGDGTAELPGVKKRFVESRENYQTVMNFIEQGAVLETERKFDEAQKKYDEAEKLARLFAANGKGHPIFIDLEQELR